MRSDKPIEPSESGEYSDEEVERIKNIGSELALDILQILEDANENMSLILFRLGGYLEKTAYIRRIQVEDDPHMESFISSNILAVNVSRVINDAFVSLRSESMEHILRLQACLSAAALLSQSSGEEVHVHHDHHPSRSAQTSEETEIGELEELEELFEELEEVAEATESEAEGPAERIGETMDFLREEAEMYKQANSRQKMTVPTTPKAEDF